MLIPDSNLVAIDRVFVVDSKTSMNDVIEKINQLILNDTDEIIAEIHTSLRSASKSISIVEIIKRVHKHVKVEIKNSKFLNNMENRRDAARLIIKLERSNN